MYTFQIIAFTWKFNVLCYYNIIIYINIILILYLSNLQVFKIDLDFNYIGCSLSFAYWYGKNSDELKVS